MKSSTLGAIRAYTFGILICVAGFLFGYDTGIVGGVLTLKSFQNDFRYSSKHETKVSSLCVGIQQAGAFFACLIIAPITERLGRRNAIMLCSLIFNIGVVLQVINTHSLPCFYIGRVVAGIGLGGASCVVPMYSAEMAPKDIRGRIGSCFQWMFTWGVFASYWIDYAVAELVPSVSRQWQIPVGLQMVPASILGLGMLTQKESVRWLARKGQHDAAWKSLSWIRADDGPTTQAEMNEIRLGIAEEERATQGFRKRELLEPANRYRIGLAMTIFLCQQCTGSTALAYFGPQFFKLLVGGGNKDLLITALFGVIKVISCGCFVLFASERIGRKWVFVYGALGMAACMIVVAVVDKLRPPPATGDVTSAGMATVAMIFLDIIIYNFSWGPLPWPYVGEIFPNRIREIGVSTGVSTQWLFNFVFSLSTPYMIASMAWGTFLLYAGFDVAMALFSLFFVKETKGKSIEEMETLFHSKAAFDVEVTRKDLATGIEDKPAVEYLEQRNVHGDKQVVE